jgi:hypothetical protein
MGFNCRYQPGILGIIGGYCRRLEGDIDKGWVGALKENKVVLFEIRLV